MKFREYPSTVVGQLGEKIVAREYRRDGWGVIASFKFSGENDNEAPAIEIDDGEREITPDLDVSKGGKRVWIEVKTHAIAAQNRKLGVGTHGVPVRLYDNYVAVEKRSGNPVFLAVVQLDTKEILVSRLPLSQMMNHRCQCGCESRGIKPCSAGPPGRYPQWYFRKDDFELLGHVDNKAFKILDEKHRIFLDDRAARQRPNIAPRRPPQSVQPHHRPLADGAFSDLDEPCGRCGRTTPDMFRVGDIRVAGGFRMCATCWRGGLPAEPAPAGRS